MSEDRMMRRIVGAIAAFWIAALVCVVTAAYYLNGPSHRVGAMFAVATIWCVITAVAGLVMLEA